MIKKVAFIATFLMMLFFLRMIYMQNIYFSECNKMQGLDRIRSCEKVILLHFPFSPYTKGALDLLINECEKLRDDEEKLYCLETLRSSLIQIRSFYQPFNETIGQINPKIAHLRTNLTMRWQYNKYSMQDYERLYRDAFLLLQHMNSPSVFWSLVVVLSLLGWISSMTIIILKGFRKSYFLALLLFLSLWLFGLHMA